MKKIVIDATDAILGRLVSYAAKQALLGYEVVIVNCNDAVVTGRRANVLKEYREARYRGGTSLKGPHFPKDPQRIVKRTVRGMVSYKQGRGLAAFKRVMCYNKVPKEYESVNKIQAGKEKTTNTIKLSDISGEL